MTEEGKGKEKEEDPRLDFVRNYVLKSHRLKLDRWQKMMGNDEYRVRRLFCYSYHNCYFTMSLELQ